MLSVYYPVGHAAREKKTWSKAVRGSNVDDQDRPTLLSSLYSDLKERSKAVVSEAAALRAHMKCKLVDNLTFTYVKESQLNPKKKKVAPVSEHLLYSTCGFMLKKKSQCYRLVQPCSRCWSTLKTTPEDLPEDFNASGYLELKNKGGLTFVTPEMFETFKAVEVILHAHFKDEYMWMLKDSFETVMDTISELKGLPLICCDIHREEYVAEMIFYYVKLRYIFETKRRKQLISSARKAKRLGHRKLTKLPLPNKK